MKKFFLLTLFALGFISTTFGQDQWQRINQNDIDNHPLEIKDMVVFKDTIYLSKSSGSAFYSGEGPSPILLRSGSGDNGDVNWEDVTPNLFYSNGEPSSFNALAVSTLGTGLLFMATVEEASYTYDMGGPVVYRSQNGTTWERMSNIGFGMDADGAFDIIEFNGNIYVSSTYVTTASQSAIFTAAFNETDLTSWTLVHSTEKSLYGNYTKFSLFNGDLYAITDKAFLFKTNDGLTWIEVTSVSTGFGNINNTAFTAITSHNDSLFIGTENSIDGPQIWKSNDGSSFYAATSASLASYTNPAFFAYYIADLNSYAGNLVVSIYRDGFQVPPGGVVLRSTDGNNYVESIGNFNGVSNSQEAITQVFKDNIYHASQAITTDYALHRVNLNPCTGIPNAGIILGDINLCSIVPQATTLTVSGASTTMGIEFAWQESNDGGSTWTDISVGIGFDSISYVTEIITYTKHFRAKVTCTNSAQFAYTNPVQINLSVLECYCQSYATNDADSKIDSVAFNTINNTSASGCAVYTDYSNIKTTIFPDSTYTFAIKTGSCGSDYTRYAKLYIDYNIDGDFDDFGEETGFVGPTTGGLISELFTYTVTVPSTVTFGETKMRVVLAEAGSETELLACGTYGYGETEDYNVYLAQPILLNSVGTGNYCEGNIFVASYTTDNYLSGNQFKLQLSNNLGSFANPIFIGTTVSTATGTINATLPLTMTSANYSVRIVATNPPSISDIKTITILPDPNIDGAVFSNSVLASGGKVSLYKYNAVYRMDVEQEVNINADGTYTFTTIPLGDYIIQAKPSVSNNPGAYFGDVQLWQDATLLSLTCGVNQTNKNVNTTPYNPLNGQGTISGGVYRGVNYGSGKTNLVGDPIPGVDVSLEQNPGGIIIAVTPTSSLTGASLGTYMFSNVPSGSYDVKVDLPGIGMSSIHTATISGAQDTTHLDYFVDSNAVYIVPSTVSIAEKMQVMQQTKVYPNPSADYILVETANNNEPVEISLYNTFGQLVYTEKTTNNKTKISVDDSFKQGVYIVKITQGSINSQHRILISK